jgi:tRNA threonylcarbamoyladenosine biosynthesis protein TsaB
MKFYMLVLALDTTTRRGSAALLRDSALLDCEIGDASRTYGERLPADLIRLLERQNLRIQDIDLFAVAAGPGSLTGMRIGIATMQGFAMANGRLMVGVSTLDALASSAGQGVTEGVRGEGRGVSVTRTGVDLPLTPYRLPLFVGAWLDAQRGEVFSALYQEGELVDEPAAGKPAVALARWAPQAATADIVFVGDGAVTYANAITAAMPGATVLPEVPPLAPAIGRIAVDAAARNAAVPPESVHPIYVRRPDVELTRDRRAAETRTPGTR